MYVGAGGPADLINWFRKNSDAQLLGLFVGGHSQFDKFLDDVLNKSATLDLVLGSKIDLIVFGGEPEIEIVTPSRQVTVPAAPLTKLRQRSDKSQDGLSVDELPRLVVSHISRVDTAKPAIRRGIKKATTLATHELSEMLKLGADDLPALILLSSTSSERLVLRTRGVADAEFVIEFLRSVRGALEKLDAAQGSAGAVRQGSVRQVEVALAQIQAEREVVEKNERRLDRGAAALFELFASGDIPLPQPAILKCISDGDPSEVVSDLLKLFEGKKRSEAKNILENAATKAVLQSIIKAHTALANAHKRISSFEAIVPPAEDLKNYLSLHEKALAEIQNTIATFERKISYKIGVERVTGVLGISTEVLAKAKKLISLALSVKTGGTHLIG